MKILIRGGSISAGFNVETSYVDILEDFCRARGVELINRSRIKDNSFDGIWSFHEDIDPYRPEILMIHFGIDDAFYPVYFSEFKENLVRMVRLARQRFNPAILIPTSHTFDNVYDMEAVYIYYRAIREVALDLDCEMIPIHTYWAGYLQDNGLSNSDLVLDDTRYPNEKGHEIFAQAIIPRLERLFHSLPRQK
ncbi:MAG TPA: SGNH/GDSL hydrolase family protein [Deltaproteobacteria bacterium]|nr:SGNH/GDSL hydrolase family protein [Deltaproteobacteria bacterium]HPR52596.1 SGNH/GDSL hydrolase family protein [Deltaproteobacteria bacterium]